VCFISSYPPNRARLSEYAQNLVSALAELNSIESIYILADKTHYAVKCREINPKVKLHRVWRADSYFSVLNVLRYILQIKPDVVHFNISFQSFGKSKLTNFCGLSLICLCRLFGFHVLAGVHTLADVADLTKYNVKPTIVNKIGIHVATKMILSSQSVIVLVKAYGASLKERYKHKGVHYIPHGTTVNAQSKIDSKDNVILLFGHMGPHKGLPVLLEAFKKIRAQKADAKLIVAGTNHPNFPNYLQQFIEMNIPNVEYTGYVPQKDLAAIFRRAQVVVLPYHAAPGTSGVFHLACGYSRPIVASDLPEIRELVKDGASAILVCSGDSEALKNAILLLLNDPSIAAEMCEKNLKFALKESWGSVAKAYENAYLALVYKE